MSLRHKVSPDIRLRKLRKVIKERGFARIIEAHSGLSALIGETTRIEKDEKLIEFDGFWESSLTDSAVKGLPDVEIIGPSERVHTIKEIINVTSKPIIVDGDTGGPPTQFEYFVHSLELLGVSAVIIEDKVFPKRNSLDASAKQSLEDPDVFAQKIVRGRDARMTDEFMIIARIESLIAGLGIEDAFMRAERYIKAGVNGIMIHSKSETPEKILEFADAYDDFCKEFDYRPILVCVPTTYNLISDKELASHGFNIIIHANHLLRSGYKAMLQAAQAILSSDRGFESEPLCESILTIFEQVGFNRIKEKDREFSKNRRLSVIIPAAGKDPIFKEEPKSLIEICDKPILRHQLESIRKIDIGGVVIVRGYKGEQFDSFLDEGNFTICENKKYDDKHSLYSLFCAEEYMGDGFILLYSDILFNEEILKQLCSSGVDIILAIDNSYHYHKHEIDKKLDLVVSRSHQGYYYRSLQPTKKIEISQVGKNINIGRADYEFIGIAYFSEEGVRILRKVYYDCLTNIKGEFHEAESFDKAGITDLLQEIIDRGFAVHGLEIFKGWMEIHNRKDIEIAAEELSSIENI